MLFWLLFIIHSPFSIATIAVSMLLNRLAFVLIIDNVWISIFIEKKVFVRVCVAVRVKNLSWEFVPIVTMLGITEYVSRNQGFSAKMCRDNISEDIEVLYIYISHYWG